ncbi:MAG: prepilin-type N-terminal cleavage/methylation domain-containing protein [bacterium]|nr:prepilin-type N-terminal cleavage/methylation domain-containing protein [bacterium]
MSSTRRGGFTLMELLLVIGLLALLSAMIVPNLLGQFMGERLPKSAQQMRALLQLTRANAMLDGKRYRLRFPLEDELDSEGTGVQPIVEREDEPFIAPGVYEPVAASWGRGVTLLDGVRCVRARLGKPTVEELLRHFDDVTAELDEEEKEEDVFYQEFIEDFEEDFPPLVFEPDGTSEWCTLVISNAPPEIEEDDLADYPRIEVIYDGLTGLAWLQRPFYEEELEMFQENGWPAVLRKDFLRPVALTEDEVIEIQESLVRR